MIPCKWKQLQWGAHATGGMGAINQAMAKAAREHGVEIEVDAPVQEMIVEKGRAVGIMLKDDRSIRT